MVILELNSAGFINTAFNYYQTLPTEKFLDLLTNESEFPDIPPSTLILTLLYTGSERWCHFNDCISASAMQSYLP